ncbi:hypothetical protein B0A54_09357 [Friedmanniomyces endolithicus]|uniref:Protein kinase domain-containing protein n=1 Tax=Friedmanniomyces endolithicus TaxID=329885 RepID=A0A4U0UWB7_9PEZI|nr:hypothetical protein LTS09_013537 [Friedmanniomyces endolithicus]TKA40408.1 hypothetical protein B0A54_09357 [Friedmanniomyces endolithicus]
MEAYRHAHHAHARRSQLTKLYSDTKKSTLTSITAYPTAIENFPDLRRKFRIQNDRLITWGLAWSDEERGADGDIDDAVARAGLTETVDSVLRNIKEVTEEAERIQHASLSHALGLGGEKLAGPPKAATFDQARYEDLQQDLTTSIDTLYDLSRSRRALARGEHPSFKSTSTETSNSDKPTSIRKSLLRTPSYASSEITLVNPPSFNRPSLSPYAGLPPSIEVSALCLPEEGPPPYESIGVPSTTRLVAGLFRPKASESVQNRLGSNAAEVPVLVEYANFDSVYRETHVPPPLQRLEALAAYFQPMRPESQTNISLLGYFEDPKQPRIGLVYDVPYAIQNKLQGTLHRAAQRLAPTSLLKLIQKASKAQAAPGEVGVPPLEDRFRVATHLAEQLLDLHSSGLAHGNINSSSVVFVKTAEEQGSMHLRAPLWASFDLFSKCNVEGIKRAINLNIYRSPNDAPHDANRVLADDIRFDMYSFALVLLEIGLWTPIGDFYKAKYTLSDFKLRLERIWIPKLAQKCGSAYMRAVQECFQMAEGANIPKLTMDLIYAPLLSRLRRCCLLDDSDTRADAMAPSGSFAEFAASSYGARTARKHVAASSDHSLLARQISDPNELLRSHSIASPSQISGSHRLTSLPSLAAASVPAAYTGMSTSAQPGVSRMPSTRSQLSHRSSISQIKQRVTERFTSQPSFRDYKRKVTVIQQAWRERAARKRELSSALSGKDSYRAQGGIPEASNEGTGDVEKTTRPTRRSYPSMIVPPEVVDLWYKEAGPRLAKLCERALKGSKESSSIAITMYGETPETAKPTFLVTCKSTAKVKQMLKAHFKHDPSFCCLRVKKTIDEIRYARRSRRYGESAARRTMAPASIPDRAANPDYQERPVCGASIGAYRDEEHLPPVSLGGVVLVDGVAYGMSVHHMLEPPDDEEEEEDAEAGADDESETSSLGSADGISVYAHSDDESTVRPPSTLSDTEEDDEIYEGDLPGIAPHDFEEVEITQPALDDAVECDLHVDVGAEDDGDSGIDEDHLLSYKLGQVFASSGLKRSTASTHKEGFRSISQSLPQEIDWALFELIPPRVQPFNIVKGGGKYCATAGPCGSTFPNAIRKSSELACAQVHCIGRTSGLASGVTSSTMEVVKIRGRSTFSASWTVSGDFGAGGDSGAWVIGNEDGKVCGHVLASKTGRTYICPMELLLEDIRTTLSATSVVLPGMETAEIGRVSQAEAEQVVVEAVSQLRLADTEVGGVKLPASPKRATHCNFFRRTPEVVETAG